MLRYQENITKDNHILNVNSENFLEEYKHIVCKSQGAYVSSQMRDEMIMEGDCFKELEVKSDMSEPRETLAKQYEEKDF
jgi:phage FluMu gp28-like protein